MSYERAKKVINRGMSWTSPQKYILRQIAKLLSGLLAVDTQIIENTDTIIIDASKANKFEVLLTEDSTLTFEQGFDGQHITVLIKQDSFGGHNLTWDPTIEWSGGSAIANSLSPNAIDVYMFVVDNSITYHGMLASRDSK